MPFSSIISYNYSINSYTPHNLCTLINSYSKQWNYLIVYELYGRIRSISMANQLYGRKPTLHGKVISTPPGICLVHSLVAMVAAICLVCTVSVIAQSLHAHHQHTTFLFSLCASFQLAWIYVTCTHVCSALSSYLGLIRILNHNMTYDSSLRDFTVVITSEMLLMLASVREFPCRLDGRGKEHHSQSKP